MTRPAVRGRRRRFASALLAAGLVAAACWTGSAVTPALGTESPLVRVGILVDRPSVQIAADGPVTAEDVSVAMFTMPPPVALPQLPGGGGWTAAANGAGGIDLGGTSLGPAVRLTVPRGFLRADGRPYRGALELRRTADGRLTVVNLVDLEEYVYGVIKGEIDPRWPQAAVRAQAVAARTLAVQRMLAHVLGQAGTAAGFDLPATTDAQVYLGVAGEDPAATAAVDATRGTIITYDERPIFAAYHSNSGGHTEDSENVWGTLYPYLRGVPDPYALEAPGVMWNAVLPLAAIESDLRRGGTDVAALDDVAPGRVTPWGRLVTVVLRGNDGRIEEMNANRFRLLVGASVLRSTMFSVARQGAAAGFTGRGSGHGVGLDQWGARAMAAHGFTFEQILKFYYTGVTLEPRY
ncbi:MAG TPA: SpoIID/LytB domain-containing protein [bacterium]|nr:SpoIID/LytB domain-containing protein [bacterium]